MIGDPYTTAFNEGQRAAFLHIQKMCSLTMQDIDDLARQLEDEGEDND